MSGKEHRGRQNIKSKYYNMKRPLLICFVALSSLISFAQEKPMLTKGETIKYLSDKINEVNGEKEPFCRSCSDKLYNAQFKEKNGLVEISFSHDIGGSEWAISYWFNPAYITSVDLTNGTSNVVGTINIFFKNGNALKKEGDSEKRREKNVTFLYLNADPSTGNRIIKALLYLRDLYKATEDPFGE